jgi:methylated-DNA-[protein]-cysteine S-methyltransferase
MRRATTASGVFYQVQRAPVGMLGMVAGERGLVEILLQPSPALLLSQLRARHPQAQENACALLQEAEGQLAAFFGRERRSFDLPIDLAGLSPFTIRVLTTLQGIPFGATVSYGELALLAGHPGAARAVGGVMAANPFPLVVPCHRVLASGGKLGGYSGGEGVATKKWLLAFEQEVAEGPFVGISEKSGIIP